MDAHGIGNHIDIVNDPEFKSFFFGYKSLPTIVTYGDQSLCPGLSSLFQTILAELDTAFWKPADGPATAAACLFTVMFHLIERNTGQLP